MSIIHNHYLVESKRNDSLQKPRNPIFFNCIFFLNMLSRLIVPHCGFHGGLPVVHFLGWGKLTLSVGLIALGMSIFLRIPLVLYVMDENQYLRQFYFWSKLYSI
mgnify:CR=1 FL=1